MFEVKAADAGRAAGAAGLSGRIHFVVWARAASLTFLVRIHFQGALLESITLMG